MTNLYESHAELPQKTNSPTLHLSDFDFSFPAHLVAQTPCPQRDHARLLVRHSDGRLDDRHVSDLTTELPSGTLLILNATKVFPSRLFGQLATGGVVELFLLEEALRPDFENGLRQNRWRALARPMRKLKPGTTLYFEGGLEALVLGKSNDDGGTAVVDVEFNLSRIGLDDWLEVYGQIPLPPYIARKASSESRLEDKERYQTVYSQSGHSVAAPTAGLHFTQSLIERLQHHGVETQFVTLNVGGGTFLPVKTTVIEQHQMHAERYKISRQTAASLLKAKAEGRPVVAVGTTSLRCLEAHYRACGISQFLDRADEWSQTDIFIHPQSHHGHEKPWAIDGLMTNFHQPCSTLFMLVSALISLNSARILYQEAILREYRLFSYGDASLLWLKPSAET